ncbi:StbB family protein [Caballeronia sp. GAWG1-1]|uniref:StbB family protein n=1 Tax=Caballeronia sp. GAWG1-1 TaxID=2921742 RepID=UPI002027B838|nr:StbB family protein [Caballeronia sp. GAWG1-1]
MKIAVINFSGNVGKSTVAQHLLAPRLGNAPVISIESINSDGTEQAALRGSQFDELQDQLMSLNNAVVDVGASNVEDFIGLMQSYDGSHEDFDYFVVPTVPAAKQQVNTIATLRSLSDLGVPASKIRLVMNMVDPKRNDIEKVFSRVFDFGARSNAFVADRAAIIYENPIYEKIKGFGMTIADIKNDPRDYVALNAKAMEEGAPEEQKARIRQMVALKRLASRVTSDLDSVFKALVH